MLRFLIKQYALFGKFFTSALSRSVFNDLHSFSLFPISTSKKAWVSENFEYNIPLLYPLLFTDMLLTQLFWNDSLWQYANFKFYWTYYRTQNIERNQLTPIMFFSIENLYYCSLNRSLQDRIEWIMNSGIAFQSNKWTHTVTQWFVFPVQIGQK